MLGLSSMIDESLGKRQRLAHQTGHALSQRVVEALDMIGLARQLGAPGVIAGKLTVSVFENSSLLHV